MPQTHTHLWPQVIDWENLHRSYIEAQRGKRYSPDSLDFAAHLEDNLFEIQNQLIWHTWTPQPMRLFAVHEPKPRQIAAPAFRDRVVHHGLVDVITPLFERRFIDHSYACRVGRGTHAAVNHVQKLIRRADSRHYFQGDIRRYFPSINHDILKSAIRRVIADPDVLWLVDTIIDAHGPGVPIGSLTSQLFANIYLDPLDHFVTDELGHGAYVRYMDDFVLVGPGRRELRMAEQDIRAHLRHELALDLNPESRSAPISRGIDFCGYRIWPYHRLPRKRNVKRARRRLQARAREAQQTGDTSLLRATVMSFIGYMQHCSSRRTLDSVLNDIVIGGPHDP
ncbi:MAG: reverse transcriptase domain-containing protein [Spirochaetaceae bacterium]